MTAATSAPFRLYEHVGADGYPPEWHETIKDLVRGQAGNRCVRCAHPYRKGEHGNGEWSPCDEHCAHAETVRILVPEGDEPFETGEWLATTLLPPFTVGGQISESGQPYEAHWRILTVHHLDNNKANCRWWNLAALCQRCHLTIQGRVVMARVWPWEHTDWFKPYVAGYYAHAYLGEDLDREQTEARLEELLALERIA